MTDLQPTDDGVLLSIRAQPGVGKNELRLAADGMLKVVVSQVAEKGKANRAILEFLAKTLGLRKSQLDLLRGDTAKSKVIRIRDISVTDLKSRIERALAD